MKATDISGFGIVLIFILGAIMFLNMGLLAARLLRPNRPNPEKLTTYESGEEPTGNAWSRFNIRYYSLALVFILFEVELVFLFPWAVIFGNEEIIEKTNGLWGWFSLGEMLVFVGILVLGLVYAWAKGYIDWVQPEKTTKQTDFEPVVPKKLYDEVNKKY